MEVELSEVTKKAVEHTITAPFEEVRSIVAAQLASISHLRSLIDDLTIRVQELERQVGE